MAERFRMDESDEAALAARTRATFSDLAAAQNERRAAKVDEAALRARNLETRLEVEQAAAAHDLEVGDWGSHAQHQRNLTELAVQRARAEDEQRYWGAQPTHPADPVEALIRLKSGEPETVRWLQSHPESALVLATNSDPAEVARIQAAHHAALAEHHVAGSREYFHCVDKVLAGGGKTTRGSGGGSGGRTSGGEATETEVRLTKGEATAATDGSVCWGREGGAKCGQPLGISEYARRKATMEKQGIWYERLD
jgi:hypothetical protein